VTLGQSRQHVAKLLEPASGVGVGLDVIQEQSEVLIPVESSFPSVRCLLANEFVVPPRQHETSTAHALDQAQIQKPIRSRA
jgi:hypothetical protein